MTGVCEQRYKTSEESAEQPRISTEQLPDNYHERDCEYVVSNDPAPCTCGYYDREQSAIDARNSRCGESRPTNSAGRPEASKSANPALAAGARSDETTQLAQSEGRQSGPKGNAQPSPSSDHSGNRGL